MVITLINMIVMVMSVTVDIRSTLSPVTYKLHFCDLKKVAQSPPQSLFLISSLVGTNGMVLSI